MVVVSPKVPSVPYFLCLMNDSRVVFPDYILSLPYFLYFDEMLGWKFLITYDLYLIFCVLTKF